MPGRSLAGAVADLLDDFHGLLEVLPSGGVVALL